MSRAATRAEVAALRASVRASPAGPRLAAMVELAWALTLSPEQSAALCLEDLALGGVILGTRERAGVCLALSDATLEELGELLREHGAPRRVRPLEVPRATAYRGLRAAAERARLPRMTWRSVRLGGLAALAHREGAAAAAAIARAQGLPAPEPPAPAPLRVPPRHALEAAC